VCATAWLFCSLLTPIVIIVRDRVGARADEYGADEKRDPIEHHLIPVIVYLTHDLCHETCRDQSDREEGE